MREERLDEILSFTPNYAARRMKDWDDPLSLCRRAERDAFALFVNLNFPPLDSLLTFFTVATKAKSVLARTTLPIALVAVETFDSKQIDYV